MTDVNALREVIREAGVTITFLAKRLGLTRECLYRKMRGESEFKASEIVLLAQALHLDSETRDQIFLHNG